jgi:TrmH family RNA methyltransferase
MSSLYSLENLRVVLVSPRNPLNIGAAARAMSNFGARTLRVVTPYEPAFREARSAVGASDLLQSAEVFAGVAEAVTDCALVVGTTAVRTRKLQHPLRPLESGARLIRKRLTNGKVALLFGSERIGLTNEDMSHCDWLLRIQTCEENISMNLGQTVAVCLYELAREGKVAATTEAHRPAVAEDVERFTELVNDSLQMSGYPGPADGNEQKVRRLIRRMKLSAEDAEVWLGIARQILWKLNNPQTPQRERT